MIPEKIEESFSKITNIRLPSNSYLNMFNILRTSDKEYFLNLFKSYIVDNEVLEKEDFFHFYQAEENDWWENISYKYYGTVNLWWLIAMVNNVNNPFEDMEPGKNIKVLKKSYLYIILRDIRNIAEL